VPTLTTIAVDFADVAAIAVAALVDRVRASTPMPHRDLRCRYDLVIGESSRPVRRRGYGPAASPPVTPRSASR
jgi:DNA-binding LacI/PurR family transcriptional regulator